MKFKNLMAAPNIFLGLQESDVCRRIINASDNTIVQGQFSCAFEDSSCLYLIRDRLGLNKLFYHIDSPKAIITASNFIFDLASVIGDIGSIFSIPAGHYLKINKKTLGKELVPYYDLARRKKPEGNFDVVAFRKKVKIKLEGVFEFLREAYSDHQFLVCLSGGLDSALIADAANHMLKGNVKAVTFSYASRSTIDAIGHVTVGARVKRIKDPSLSEDLIRATAIAAVLGLEHIAVLSEKIMDLAILDEVIKNCQDWRDFNVHCAWVNHIICCRIKEHFLGQKIIFLTGDLMNEFVADYTTVEYKGDVYYPQLRIPKEKLRRFFLYGLDTGDREIGVFLKQGAVTVQPYAVLAEDYWDVPADYLEKKDCKRLLSGPLLSNPALIPLVNHDKLRSQVGGSDGGTLGLFHDSGITQQYLKDRWEWICSRYKGVETAADIICAGRYRSGQG